MILELAQDFQEAKAAMPSEHPKHRMLELLEEAIRRDIHFVNRHPTTLFQCMWNTCRWRETAVLPDLLEVLEAWSQRREGQPVWYRAEAALPDSQSKTSLAMAFGEAVLAQAYDRARHLLAVVRPDGRAEILQLPDGAVAVSTSLGSTDIEGVALAPDSLAFAYRRPDGGIAMHGSTAVFRSRPGDRPYLLRSDDSIIATTEGGDLICWNPETHHITTLAADIPHPLRVLRESEESGQVLFVAGGREQQVGVCTPVAEGWRPQTIRCSGPEVVDADSVWEGGCLRIALLRKDRSVCVVDQESGAELAEVRYQKRHRLLTGAPQRIMGRPDAIYFVTIYGGVGRWKWQANELDCVAKLFEKTEAPPVVLFEDTGTPDTILVSTCRAANLVDVSGTAEKAADEAKHDGRSACCAIQRNSNLIASASQNENSVRTYTLALKPCGRHAFPEPTSIALTGGCDASELFVGNRNGYLTTVQPGSASCAPGQKLSAESIVGIVPLDNDRLLVADRSGRLFWLPRSVAEPLPQFRRQIKIARADRLGIAWSLYERGGQWIVDRVSSSGNVETVLTSKKRILDMATSEDGRQICLAGEMLSVHRPGNPGALTGDVGMEARLAAFVGRDLLCVVLAEDDTSIEVRRVVPGLPVVTTICLGHSISCLGNDGAALAVGLESGHVCSLTLCDGPEPIQEEGS